MPLRTLSWHWLWAENLGAYSRIINGEGFPTSTIIVLRQSTKFPSVARPDVFIHCPQSFWYFRACDACERKAASGREQQQQMSFMYGIFVDFPILLD
jgi:hypothetical protein